MADDTIQIEYNDGLKPLEKLLSAVQRAGDFCVSGAVEIPLPLVEIAGMGVLSFPVPPSQIAEIIPQATRAPYGRGEATLLDEAVRKVWQLPPDKVRLGGKSWPANFDGILKQVSVGLGCEGMVVRAELYKLLVYDTGGFFLAHRDTEKADGMFGTLVISLPSAHRGGELVIRHLGREVTVDLSHAEFSEVSFAAFYADCEHEVRPITQGNRVCLVYNLIQERGAKGAGNSLEAPNYEKHITAVAALLEDHLSAPGAPVKLAWLLEHQYSPDGLAFAALKSADAARVKVLAQAAERAGCAVHLGIVHIEESGAAEENYVPYRSRGRGRYRDDDPDQEAGTTGDQDFEIIEVCDSRHYVDQWRDPGDQAVGFGEIPLQAGELLPAGALDREKPDQQRLMEASGNEGASFERSYHRAALVLWRRERYAEVLLQAGVAAALPCLKERIEAANAKNAPPAAREEAVVLGRRLVMAWQAAPGYSSFRQPRGPEQREEMLQLLNKLADTALLEQFIAEAMTRDYDGNGNAALVASARLLDAKPFGRIFSELIRQHMCRYPGPCVELLAALTAKGKAAAKPEYRNALHEIAEAAVSQLEKIGEKPAADYYVYRRTGDNASGVDAAVVAKLLDMLGDLQAPALRLTAVKKFATSSAVFDPVTIITPALEVIRDWDAAAAQLWEHGAKFLLERSGQPPAAPKDWRQNVKLPCSCADCRELQAFTLDPVEQGHRFRARQDRRQHLEQQIISHHLDMTCRTDTKGSPQTLVCTKDQRTYQNRCAQYRKDIAALAALAAQARKISDADADALQRIEAARERAGKWSPE